MVKGYVNIAVSVSILHLHEVTEVKNLQSSYLMLFSVTHLFIYAIF